MISLIFINTLLSCFTVTTAYNLGVLKSLERGENRWDHGKNQINLLFLSLYFSLFWSILLTGLIGLSFFNFTKKIYEDAKCL